MSSGAYDDGRLMGGECLGLFGIAFFAGHIFGLGFLFRYLGLIDMDLSDH